MYFLTERLKPKLYYSEIKEELHSTECRLLKKIINNKEINGEEKKFD